MKYDPIPVTPALITWARTRAGYSVHDLSQDFKSIEAWESGKGFPTYPKLEEMAEKFKVPVAVFFFPEPPDVPAISESFRTLPDHEFKRLPQRIQYLVRKAKAFQISLAELTGEVNPTERFLLPNLSFEVDVSIAKMAEVVRDYLGVAIEEQTQWPSTEIALDSWRKVLLECGVFVFKDQFRVEGYSGFCLYDEVFPLIYVNNTSTKSRQIFTLFHELAHLLFATSGIDSITDDYIERLANGDRKIEILCNRFAAEFLLPEKVLEKALSGSRPTEETAERLASEFNISRELIFRRFKDRGLISQMLYETAVKKWNEQRKSRSGGGDYYNNVIAYLGREFINLAFSQYYQNRINDSQLADHLGIKSKSLNTLEEYVMRGAVG